MQANHYEVYAQFLLDCKKVMHTLDLEKLMNDSAYKAEVFSRVNLNADHNIFKIANLVNQELDEEMSTNH